jgi:hypothetical protein
MAGNVRRYREKLLQRNPNGDCFYCGFGFAHSIFNNAPVQGGEGYKKFKRRVKATAEHLHPASQGGGVKGNVVLAHACCNLLVADKDIIEKYKLVGAIRELPLWKEKMSIYLDKVIL